jgi:hypothetical protein
MRAKLRSLAAMLMIGDGVFAAVTPRRHAKRWQDGPGWWRRLLATFRRRPALTRALGLAEIAAGIVWARRLRPRRA